MLQTVLKPFRLLIEGIGLLLVRLGVIDRQRAKRASDLAWPRIVTGLARMSKSTVDIAMVGAAVGAPAIAGVGLATPYWVLAFMIGGGIAGGTISLVSQHVGGGHRDTVSVAVKVSAVFAVVTTLPLAVLFWSMPVPLLRLIGAEGEVLALGAQYLQVTSLAMPFAALNLVASRTLVGANDAWTPMVIRTGGAVANFVLNAVLIFGLGLGVVGAALGTVLANIAVTTVFAWGLLGGRLPILGALPVRVRWTSSHWNGKTARDLATISTPLALTNMAQMGAQFPLLAIVSLFGPDVLAAFVIALRLRDLMNTPGWGFGLASSSLVGQALGQNREGEAGAYGRDVLRFSVTVYALAAIVVFAFAGPISRLFGEAAALPATIPLIRVTCVSVVFWGLLNGAIGPLRAGGDTRWPFYGQMVGLVVFALPLAYLGATTPLGLIGLYLALVLETGVPAAITYARYRTDAWKAISRAYRPTA